ncbi:MAG: SDR family NAD(P)-dependent oxidoreductase [Tardiphaga sp.]|nr:SDR family NAD(P)-dependent oxidoreductase [Tardiphaga sp.]
MASTSCSRLRMATEHSSGAMWRDRFGPWALVTGASDGIGQEMARELARRGLNLVLVARREDRLTSLAVELEGKHKIDCRVIATDLGERAAVEALLVETEPFDIGLLVACAGFGTAGLFVDLPLASEIDMLEVNCSAVLSMTHTMARRFVRRGQGGIILMSSIVAFQGVPYAATYAATKAFVQTLAESIRPELALAGVDVIASAPAPVATGFAARSGLAMGRAEEPGVVARQTIAALGRKTTVRRGFLAKFLIGSLATLPRSARTRIMSGIMHGMVRKHAALQK